MEEVMKSEVLTLFYRCRVHEHEACLGRIEVTNTRPVVCNCPCHVEANLTGSTRVPVNAPNRHQ
jgi:hypothetical protein